MRLAKKFTRNSSKTNGTALGGGEDPPSMQPLSLSYDAHTTPQQQQQQQQQGGEIEEVEEISSRQEEHCSNSIPTFQSLMTDPNTVERVRVKIKDAHVFKLPPRQTAGGWRGADWREKVWQGDIKVVDRGDQTAALLIDKATENIFAVCPMREGSIDRCVDSSRYFILRVENERGKHMFIGVAFNERNDAFDFNTALEDSRREREMEKMPVKPYTGPTKDYSLKSGQKIHVNIPKGSGDDNTPSSGSCVKRSVKAGRVFLSPPPNDTTSRTKQTAKEKKTSDTKSAMDDSGFPTFPNDPFA